MTNELEKQFFDTFGIEARACIASCSKCQHYSYDYCLSGYCTLDSDYDNCGVAEKQYPQITDRILLELICIANEHENYSATTNMKNIKERTLRILLKTKKYLKDAYSHKGCHNGLVRKVRTLFEEG